MVDTSQILQDIEAHNIHVNCLLLFSRKTSGFLRITPPMFLPLIKLPRTPYNSQQVNLYKDTV